MAKSKTKWPVIAGIAFIVLIIGLIAYSTFGQRFGNTSIKCEVCVVYHGKTNCGTSAAATREQAERTALDLACDRLGNGMTELGQCRDSRDQTLTCK
jgi:hypothetical protein